MTNKDYKYLNYEFTLGTCMADDDGQVYDCRVLGINSYVVEEFVTNTGINECYHSDNFVLLCSINFLQGISEYISNAFNKAVVEAMVDYEGFPKDFSAADTDTRDYNVGTSNYSELKVQPWDIFKANPQLNYLECDIIKRIMRKKDGKEGRLEDIEKMHHILDELKVWVEDGM